MILGPDFTEFVALCELHEVRYLIVGGLAVGVHGHIRYTKDADCWHNRLRVELGDVTANVIGLDDLVANKRASGRLRDLADIEDLGQG